MVTNDDGVQSEGIIALAKSIKKNATVVIVGPEQPQSAAALSLTFHKPLRVSRSRKEGLVCYAVSGSPGDSVMIGVNKIMFKRPDLVASGINYGDNVTYQDILASGTVAAALEASLMGIPAVAFSMEVPEETIFSTSHAGIDFSSAAVFAGEIVHELLEEGMPEGIDLLNVNFPWHVNLDTKLSITRIEKRKYVDRVLVRKDPRRRPYYWLWGQRLSAFRENSDAFAVHSDRAISISPMIVNMSAPISDQMDEFKERVERRFSKVKNNLAPTHK
jgi:5'-nucleotidase